MSDSKTSEILRATHSPSLPANDSLNVRHLEIAQCIIDVGKLNSVLTPLITFLDSFALPYQAAERAHPTFMLGGLQSILLHPSFTACISSFGYGYPFDDQGYPCHISGFPPYWPPCLTDHPLLADAYVADSPNIWTMDYSEASLLLSEHHCILNRLGKAARESRLTIVWSNAEGSSKEMSPAPLVFTVGQAWELLHAIEKSVRMSPALLAELIYSERAAKALEEQIAWEFSEEYLAQLFAGEMEVWFEEQREYQRLRDHDNGYDDQSFWEQETYIDWDED